MSGRVLTSAAVDRRYKEAQGFRSTAAQARQLAEQFLARSRYSNHVNQAAGGSTGAERGTGGIGTGWFGESDTPPRMDAPVLTGLRRWQDKASKGEFGQIMSAEIESVRPRSQRGDFYSKLRPEQLPL